MLRHDVVKVKRCALEFTVATIGAIDWGRFASGGRRLQYSELHQQHEDAYPGKHAREQ